jgi:hypothetical protein
LEKLRQENKELRVSCQEYEQELANLHVALVKMEGLYRLFMEKFDGCTNCYPTASDTELRASDS